MSAFAFPFRRQTEIPPLIIPITAPGAALSPVQVDRSDWDRLGVETFELFNPSDKMGIWLRGWNGLVGDAPQIFQMGHYLPPMGGKVSTSQLPDWVAVVADNTLDHPVFQGGGNSGTFLYPGRNAVLIYGGGA